MNSSARASFFLPATTSVVGCIILYHMYYIVLDALRSSAGIVTLSIKVVDVRPPNRRALRYLRVPSHASKTSPPLSLRNLST